MTTVKDLILKQEELVKEQEKVLGQMRAEIRDYAEKISAEHVSIIAQKYPEEGIRYIPLIENPEFALVVFEDWAYIVYANRENIEFIGAEKADDERKGLALMVNMLIICACKSCDCKWKIEAIINEIRRIDLEKENLCHVRHLCFRGIYPSVYKYGKNLPWRIEMGADKFLKEEWKRFWRKF